jgi:hypothetical protein
MEKLIIAKRDRIGDFGKLNKKKNKEKLGIISIDVTRPTQDMNVDIPPPIQLMDLMEQEKAPSL